MFRKSFKARIIFPTAAVVAALVVILNIFMSLRFAALRDSLIDEKIAANVNSLKFYLEDGKANSRVAAISMAQHIDAINAIRDQDREEILRIFTPVQDLYRITYFTVCDSEGTVLARTYEPDNYGDSVSNQQNVKDALEGKISTYFESGTLIRVAIRTGAPVYDTDGTIIGIISAGIRFDLDSQVEELKRILNAEVTILSGNIRIATTITENGHSIVGTLLDPEVARIVIDNKQEFTGEVVIEGIRYSAFYLPLLNARGESFATFFLGNPEAEIIKASRESIRDGIILGFGGLALAIALLLYIISSISEPIIKLSKDMNQIANGDLNVEINADTEDEVGHLGRSLKKAAGILHKLLDDINVMISEHSKGNTDYVLNTKEFLGDYRILADSVLELAAMGMKDQLTGIPNRRTFDNRLDLEWNRSIRDKTQISIIMLDVDKFKNYNDTFGHQQGDVALKTIAATIKNSIKRATDFAGRWGGEEFIVLLPSTDSNGAMSVAERIRAAIEGAVIPCADPKGNKETVSIGVSTMIPEKDSVVGEFITMVDEALYRAKETGRNRAVFNGDII